MSLSPDTKCKEPRTKGVLFLHAPMSPTSLVAEDKSNIWVNLRLVCVHYNCVCFNFINFALKPGFLRQIWNSSITLTNLCNVYYPIICIYRIQKRYTLIRKFSEFLSF